MPFPLVQPVDADLGAMLVALAAGEGSASHPYLHSYALNGGPLATRNLADVLHLLTLLHGTQPGLIDATAAQNVVPEADAWLAAATRGFVVERAQLAQLIVAASPPPGTPGEAESAAVVTGQRHALGTIAASERFGCALGAAVALVHDWQPIRALMDTAAERLGVPCRPILLPNEATTARMLATLPPRPRLERTLGFGARQLLAQQRGLWDLLEARAGARGA